MRKPVQDDGARMIAEGQAIATQLAVHGLLPRGGFSFAANERRPDGPSGEPAGSVLLIGSAGAGWWPAFRRWVDRQPDVVANPLDTWSREVIGGIAMEAGARPVMPNDLPYAPFQQWATRAEGLKASPLGLLMHPEYGLWHAYRAALLFDDPLPRVSIQVPDTPIHPCDACAGKPCLKSCPVDAYTTGGFDHRRCVDHVRGASGTSCRSGCLDRDACPIGVEWRYPPEVQTFLQRSFVRLP